MAEWKVLITDRAWPDFEVESQLLGDIGATIIPATDTVSYTHLTLPTILLV